MAVSSPVLDIDALLAPVSSDTPAGVDLRYESVYDKIKEARRDALDLQMGKGGYGEGDGAMNPAERAAAALSDWRQVHALVADALTTKSKDLQLAVWLLEAQTYLSGFGGAAAGFTLIRRLLEMYWDGLFPAIDEDDSEPTALRVSVLDWINHQDRLPTILRTLPLTSGTRTYSLADLEIAQKATGDEARKELEREGRPSAEQIVQAVGASSLEHLQRVNAAIEACSTEMTELEKVTDARLDRNVAFGNVRKVLETCQYEVGRALRAKTPREAKAATTSTEGQPTAPGDATFFAEMGGDGLWQRALALVQQGQLEGLLLAQGHIETAGSGRERFLRQLQLSELCVQSGMHSFAYPILDELGRIIDERNLVSWEDAAVIRRTWTGLASVCRPLARIKPESVERQAVAQQRLTDLSGTAPPPPPADSES